MSAFQLSSVLLAATAMTTPAFAQDIRQADNAWFTVGQERIQA